MATIPKQNPEIFAFLGLHSHVLPFVRQQIILGDTLLAAGHTPVFVRIAHCSCSLPLGFTNPTNTSYQGCESCQAEEQLLRLTLPGWKIYTLEDFSDEHDTCVADQLVRDLPTGDPTALEHQAVPVGKIALHDIALKFKVAETALATDKEVAEDYAATVRGSVLSMRRMERLARVAEISHLITYNANYSINRAVAMHCQNLGVAVYSMSGGTSLRDVWETLIVCRGTDMDAYRLACPQNWSKGMRNRISSPAEVRSVTGHLEELMSGRKRHAYSAPAGSLNPRALIDSAADKSNGKRVVLLCLSSPDEHVSCVKSGIMPDYPSDMYLFPHQDDIMEFLIDKAASNPDATLVVRVHPREGQTKGEKRSSSNISILRQRLKTVPDNVFVNWPDQHVSFYDLLQHVDVVATIGSTTLLEASAFGCPIILPSSPMQYYDACADSVCSDREEYWNALVEASVQDWSLGRAIKTFRWYWMMFFGASIYLTTKQKRECTVREWIMRGFDYASKAVFLGRPPYTTISSAYSGNFKSLIYRPDSPRGASAAISILTEGFDAMDDFEQLQRMQALRSDGLKSEQATPESERRAVRDELAKLAAFLNVNRDTCPHSKFLQMLERETSDLQANV